MILVCQKCDEDFAALSPQRKTCFKCLRGEPRVRERKRRSWKQVIKDVELERRIALGMLKLEGFKVWGWFDRRGAKGAGYDGVVSLGLGPRLRVAVGRVKRKCHFWVTGTLKYGHMKLNAMPHCGNRRHPR